MQSAQALAWTGAKAVGALPHGFTGVGTDTRSLGAGELFVALRGPRFDGADFLALAASSGASAAVVGERAPAQPESLPRLVVADTLRALGDLAKGYRRTFHPKAVLAVTGSVGKTTVKELLAAALSPLGEVLKTDGNLNNEIGLPLTIFRLRSIHTAAVLEMGMSHHGEIARLTEIAQPDIGVVTSVQPVHLEFLGTIEEVAKAKGELFFGLPAQGIAIANADDPRVMEQATASGRKVVTFGTGTANVALLSVESADLGGVNFRVKAFGESLQIHLPLLGEHNALNACAALAAAVTAGVDASQAARALESARTPPHRLQAIVLDRRITLLDDCYNASPVSMRAALSTLRRAAAGHRLGAVLGDMLELGPDERELHRQVGREAAGLSWLLAVGPRASEIAIGASEVGVPNISQLADPEDLARGMRLLEDLLQPGDAVLLKGSRGVRLERFAAALGAPDGSGGTH
jgi:UDP-N-acetylmuramoyl-tripeptide--D-alanyl-D-alanine ligase